MERQPFDPRQRLRADLLTLEPYSTPAREAPVRLASNESPAAPSGALGRELAAEVERLALHRYPDREARGLREVLAARCGVGAERVWVANGSNEILQQLFLAFGGPRRVAVTFNPTYSMYEQIARVTGTGVRAVPLSPRFEIGVPEAQAAAAARPDLVLVCSPNNPTGNAQRPGVAGALADATGALVVVDEAYAEFAGTPPSSGGGDHDAVVSVRTLSKAFAMAGARLGYCVAEPELIDGLRRVSLPYHLSGLAQAAGLVALRHDGEMRRAAAALADERDRLSCLLAALPGVTVLPSAANFVTFRPACDAGRVWQGLLNRGVLVRDVSSVLPGFLRVTAGTSAEGDRFIDALGEVLA
jgi:histidinol-phosphate aminotransferase